MNIQFDDERISAIDAQRFDQPAQAEAEQTDAAPMAEPKPITGEISQLIEAAGSVYGDPVMLELVELLGPGLDSHDIDAADGGGRFLVFEGGGVDLQYREDVLLAVLIHVGEGERGPYPRLDALVEGLAFPAMREDVRTAVGEPRDSRSNLDLYEQQGTSVIFYYRSDLLATISIAQLPEEWKHLGRFEMVLRAGARSSSASTCSAQGSL